jgi:hypothetical protein
MKELNPKSRDEFEQEEAARRFLAGEGEAPRRGVAGGHKH